MQQNPEFGKLLSEGIISVARRQGWTVDAVQRKITEALAAQGHVLFPSTVRNWRRGFIPKSPEQIAALIHYCADYGRVDRAWAESLLRQARYPHPGGLLQEAFTGKPEQRELASTPQEPVTEAFVFPAPFLLPPRPRRLFGRGAELKALLRALEQDASGLIAITGMPGVGKSALAAELLHRLASDSRFRRLFPDGIVTISGRERRDMPGLLAVLADLVARFQQAPTLPEAHLVQQASMALAGKRALLLLDNLDPDFPLAQALEVLLVRGPGRGAASQEMVGCAVLITSHQVPAPGLAAFLLRLEPLEPAAALEMLTHLMGRPFEDAGRPAAQRICAMLGFVPLALEWAAAALSLGLSAQALATYLSNYDGLLAEKGGLHERFVQAIAALPAGLQERFARLAPLGTAPFSLEQAAMMRLPEAIWSAAETSDSLSASAAERMQAHSTDTHLPAQLPGPVLVETIADLMHLESQSLVLPDRASSGRFRVPPLVHAVAADLARKQYNQALELARQYKNTLPVSLHQQMLSQLAHAFYSRNYHHVIELAYSLFQPAGNMPLQQGEQVLHWGIKASQELQDRYYLVRFLTRLGKLQMFHGDDAAAEKILGEATELAQPLLRRAPLEQVSQLLRPWSNLTLIPGWDGGIERAEYRVRQYLRQGEQAESGQDVAHAYLKLGFYARLAKRLDAATRNLETSIKLAKSHGKDTYFTLELELEQARIVADFERSMVPFESLLQVAMDTFTKADLFFDQAQFALNQQRVEEARAYVLQSIEFARKSEAPKLAARSQRLLLQVPR